MAGPGRPKAHIDWEVVTKLAALFCTAEEIAEFIGVHCDTLEIRCKKEHDMLLSEYLKQKRMIGKVSLRRAQFERAKAGNITMLIWLGKQYLEQTDKIKNDTEMTIKNVHDALAKILDEHENNVFSA